jgi:SAM-dependent methyltransferase
MRVHDTDGTSMEGAAEYAERSFHNWQAAAAGWDAQREHVAESMRALTDWLLEAIDPRPGEAMLELAAGPGQLALDLAARLQPGGHLLCTDRSPNMVEAGRRAAREAGLAGVEHRVADALALDLPDSSMDAVVCRMGYMLMADPERAFAETRRVLRPAGRVGFVVWAGADQNPWATTLFGALEDGGWQPPAAPGGPGMFSLAEPGRRAAILRGAGLRVIRDEPVPVVWDYPSFDAYWEIQGSLSGGISRLRDELPGPEVERLRDAVRSAIEPLREGQGYRLHGLAAGVLARPEPGPGSTR